MWRDVVSLDSGAARDPRRSGEKAARLAMMKRLGLPVPGGAVVTAAAFRGYCARNGVDAVQGPREKARCILAGRFPEALAAAIERAVRRRAAPHGFAVRSSALGEDGASVSMAGQLVTRLGVAPDHILSAVKECWAALFGGAALAYRARQGLDRTADMAVLLQTQLQPTYAGVLYSIDPVTRAPGHLVVEWVEGLGDALVSAQVTPGRARVDRRDPVAPFEVPVGLREALVELSKLAFRAEEQFGCPLDVEWAVDSAGVHLLQARPITALAQGELRLWSSVNLSENFPEPLSPFTRGVVERFYEHYFGAGLRRMGRWRASSDRRDQAERCENLVGYQRGRVYYNLGNWYALLEELPSGGWLQRFFDSYIGQKVPVRELSTARSADGPGVMARLRDTAALLRAVAHHLTLGRQLTRFEEEFRGRRRAWRRQDLARLGLPALRRLLDEVLAYPAHHWGPATLSDLEVLLFTGLLDTAATRWLAGRARDFVPAWLHVGGVRSTEPARLMARLADLLRDDPRCRGLLEAGDDAALEDALPAPARRILDSFMQEYGGRCYYEALLTHPTFEERHDLFWDLVRAALRNRAPGDGGEPAVPTASRTLRYPPNLPQWKRMILRQVVQKSRRALAFRERARLCQSLLFGEIRRVALEIGRRLAADRLIEGAHDVFYLEVEEVRQIIDGRCLLPATLPDVVRVRRSALDACREVSAPELFVLQPAEYVPVTGPAVEAGPVADDGVLHGLGVSRGVTTARCRIIVDPARPNALEPGEILVAPATDPGWTPLLAMAGAMVVERGGLLSHAAIVAREFGLPAVVGIEHATRQLRDGQIVTVDGDRGEVRLHGSHPSP